VVNIDRFDVIIGMGFMRKFGIMLEPKHDSILINGVPAPTFSEGEALVTTTFIIKTRHCLDSNCVYYHGSYENAFH